jgi:hypothetical protein
MAGFQVKAAAVVLPTLDGGERYLYRSAAILSDEGYSEAGLEHALSSGLIVRADEAPSLDEVAATQAEVEAAAAEEQRIAAEQAKADRVAAEQANAAQAEADRIAAQQQAEADAAAAKVAEGKPASRRGAQADK